MSVQAKNHSDIQVEVPVEFAADFLTDHLRKPLDTRPALPLRLGDTDLGMWQVRGLTSVLHDAGYSVVIATLRAVWE